MKQKVKLLGERNSGTNFFATVLENGYDIDLYPHVDITSGLYKFILKRARIRSTLHEKLHERFRDREHFSLLASNGGWKHAAITNRFITKFAKPNDCHIICIVRHPLAWARSMHRNPFHSLVETPTEFDKFISNPWITRSRDELAETNLDSPLLLWLKKIQSYREFSKLYDQIHIVKYEDVLFDTEAVHKRLAGLFTAKTDKLELPQNNCRSFDPIDKNLDDYIEASRSVSFKNLTKEECAPFIKYIGYDLIKEFGYETGLQ